MSNNEDSSTAETSYRNWLAFGLTGVSIGGVIALSITIIIKGGEPDKVLTAVLPLLGVWVGTVLAYYFSKENFEAANRSVREMAKQLTPMEKLMSIPVKSKMIPRSEMMLLNITPDKTEDTIKINDDILKVLEEKKRNRLPILDKNNHPKYMIHRSMIDKYLTRKIVKDKMSLSEVEDLTLRKLLEDDAELKRIFENGFAIVKADANLGDAKIEMESESNCQDIFVTINGTKNEPVIGWITNLIITENAKL
ncbi:MAG: hypothetical protein MRK02_10285 [Candidatus Scalindua sp.]|nr:hypothetical protein [Candidatus Scalindua sp.]